MASELTPRASIVALPHLVKATWVHEFASNGLVRKLTSKRDNIPNGNHAPLGPWPSDPLALLAPDAPTPSIKGRPEPAMKKGRPMPEHKPRVGLVAIGRNEGERLRCALQAIAPHSLPTVYVDSGSTDGSVDLARSMGSEVVELDMSTPFTAARARNRGFDRLSRTTDKLDFVQFIDGDCELDDSWLEASLAHMAQHPRCAAVGGRCREKFPNASIYNRLVDSEWNTPIGESMACGGNALIRAEAFQQVNGFDEAFAAGEEPEMCFRMRDKGWSIWRIDAEMVRHDADITHWRQWWMRSKRSGSAYAQGAWTHGRSAELYNVKDSARIWLWAGVVPAGALALAPVTLGFSVAGAVGGYGLLLTRMANHRIKAGDSTKDALTHSAFNLLGKFPQLQGQVDFLRRRSSSIIDHRNG